MWKLLVGWQVGPTGQWVPVQQDLVNRPTITLVWKNQMVTQQVYQDVLIKKLLPAILQKWPTQDQLSRKVFIQQDAAKTHIRDNDRVFKEALIENGINGELYTQAANSPDMNLQDLGFFRVIQSFNVAVPKMKQN